jgi:hypothetical protein
MDQVSNVQLVDRPYEKIGSVTLAKGLPWHRRGQGRFDRGKERTAGLRSKCLETYGPGSRRGQRPSPSGECQIWNVKPSC